MSVVLVMPKAGLTMVEGTVGQWMVSEGAEVKKGDVLFEYVNEKTNIEFESHDAGFLHIVAKEGDVVPVGETVGYIAQTKEEYDAMVSGEAEPKAEAQKAETKKEVVSGETSDILMPKAGLTMVEGTVNKWFFKEGDQVKKGDALFEYVNEKTNIEYEAHESGYLHIIAKEGDVKEVGGLVGIIAFTKESYDKVVGGKEETNNSVCANNCPTCKKEIAVNNAKNVLAQHNSKAATNTGRIKASGLAKKIAKVEGIDLSNIVGTGPNGRIVAKNVYDYMESIKNSPVAKTVEQLGEVTKIPIKGVRKAIANNMYSSLHDMAQCTASVEVDVTELLQVRARLVVLKDTIGCKITVNDMLSRATIKMLKKHPLANATCDGKEITTYPYVNLSMAVGAEAGLMVPVIRGAENMSLAELSMAIKDSAERAREGKLRDGEQSGGTFTITNVGMYPIDTATPVINPPQVAILGFGRTVKKQVVMEDDTVCIRSMMNMFLTFDHRVFDGLEVGRILQDMKTYIENPDLILI